MNTETIIIRVPKPLKEDLERQAKDEGLSLSSFVRKLLIITNGNKQK